MFGNVRPIGIHAVPPSTGPIKVRGDTPGQRDGKGNVTVVHRSDRGYVRRGHTRFPQLDEISFWSTYRAAPTGQGALPLPQPSACYGGYIVARRPQAGNAR